MSRDLQRKRDSAEDGAPKPSLYKVIKDVIAPALSVVGMLVSTSSPWKFGAFLAVGLVMGGAGLYPRIKQSRELQARASKEAGVAKAAWPSFRRFVRRFGDFVDTRTSSTLHSIIVQGVPEPQRAALMKQLGTPTIELWYQFWYFLSAHADRHGASLSDLSLATSEFHNLIGQFHNFCVAPIFNRVPQDVRAMLTDQDRSALNGFQQRFHSFETDYDQFIRHLAESHPTLQYLPRHLPASSPL